MNIIKYTLFTLIFGLFLGILPIHAVIVEGEQGTLGAKTITLLGDVHWLDQHNGICQKQKKDLIAGLWNQQNALVVVEDIFDYSTFPDDSIRNLNEKLSSICEQTDPQTLSTQLLPGLTNLCRANHINVYNADFRHFKDFRLDDETAKINATKVDNDATRKVIDEIGKYKDDNDIYQKLILESEHYKSESYTSESQASRSAPRNISESQASRNIRARVAEKYLRHSPTIQLLAPNDFIDNLEESCMYINQKADEYKAMRLEHRASLLEARILNQILTSDKEHIIICAGKAHIDMIKQIIKPLGYQTEKTNLPNINNFYTFYLDNSSATTLWPIDIKQLLPPQPLGLSRWLQVGTTVAYGLYARFFKK